MAEWMQYNPNPSARNVGDCAVRAVSKALNVDWETAYAMIAAAGFQMGDVISSNSVWGSVLRNRGFYRHIIPNTCPDCYTVGQFADLPWDIHISLRKSLASNRMGWGRSLSGYNLILPYK